MAAKEKTVGVRLDPETELFIRREADALDMNVSELIRRAVVLGIPLLRQIPSLRDVRVKDITPAN